MKRVLLTGASGFVGRHCLAQLVRRGYEVHAVSRKKCDALDLAADVTWHQADLLVADEACALVNRVHPTHLLHLAWYAAPGEYWTAAANLDWVAASLRLLKAFAEQGGNRAVIAGSCAEYDWTEGYCSEQSTALVPATLYGASKLALQLVVDAYAREKQFSAAWGRLFFLYGPYEDPRRLVAYVARSLIMHERPQCSSGLQQRDFLFVEDAASAFAALLDSEVQGPVNIASGEAVAVRDVVRQIAEMLGQSASVDYGTADPEQPSILVADVGRLSREVGWKPMFDLNRGLNSTVAWWREALRS